MFLLTGNKIDYIGNSKNYGKSIIISNVSSKVGWYEAKVQIQTAFLFTSNKKLEIIMFSNRLVKLIVAYSFGRKLQRREN